MRQPVVFVSHGSPTLIRDATPAHEALRALGRSLPRPQAVLAVSAHWETAAPTLDVSERPQTIHDFGGFARDLYSLHYPAPGAPAVAARAQSLLEAAGYHPAPPATRGLDHGAWVPLGLLWPEADVPVTQLSVDPARDAGWHRALGAALAPLREEGVLIVASGAVTHNLRAMAWGTVHAPVPAWVDAFADWTAARVTAGEPVDAWTAAPHAADNHPSPEHFLPLAVAQGAAGTAPGRQVHRSAEYGALRMDAFLWD